MKSRILVNDGQHRRAAIAEALKEQPRLGDETISVVLFVDAGLERSQQWFADLNKHAVRPTRSISVLYDRRDPMSQLSRELVCQVPIFGNGFTELEKTSVSNRSTKIFTLNAIYQSTRALLSRNRHESLKPADKELAVTYWTKLSELIPEWRMVIQKQISPAELRQRYIHVHGVVLHALGIVGRTLIQQSQSWQHEIAKIENINWERSNTIWQGRSIVRGKISKDNKSVTLTANVIKMALGLVLSKDELLLEHRLTEHSGK